MRRLWILCVLLLGCGGSSQLPDLAVFEGTCVSDGVRIDAAGATPYHEEQHGEITIRNGVMTQGPCNVPIIGFDGRDFDMTSTSCELASGVRMFVNDGAGTLEGDRLTIKSWTTIDDTETGVTLEFTSSCTATRVR